MNPIIVDPIPSTRPSLPFMASAQDAAKLNAQERTTFYLTAFMFQCWLSQLFNDGIAQLAEKPNPADRAFQSGQARAAFAKLFGQASDAEFSEIFDSITRFAGYDDIFCQVVLDAVFPLSLEHELTGDYLGKRTPPELALQPKKVIALMRRTTHRLCDWVDSVLHYQVFQYWHLSADSFAPDPINRELTALAHNQREFDLLDQPAQARWLLHMSDAALEYKHTPQWAAFRQTANGSGPEPRPWPNRQLDRTLIKLWPLLKPYHCSAADLLCLLQEVLPASSLAPCQTETALALRLCAPDDTKPSGPLIH
ncbi:MAG TPA: hypothetical protein VN578_01550 [Candidatus Binatia bacterium]|jgi:hypothetical protein|nr:hypothetical protein [Candidatus Binatia bacterium]